MSTTAMGINLDRVLKIGQPVSLALNGVDEPASVQPRSYMTVLQDVSASDLIVGWPTDQTVHVPARVGQQAGLEMRCHLGILYLDSKISDTRRGPVPVLQITRDGDWSRSQLRASVRLDVAIIPHKVTLAKDTRQVPGGSEAASTGSDGSAARNHGAHPERFKAVIRNLSAAGFLLASEIGLAPGSILGICFPLGPNQPDISALATVVRLSADTSGSKTYQFLAGCRFLDLPMRDQDSITRFVLTRQAELRRSGLL